MEDKMLYAIIFIIGFAICAIIVVRFKFRRKYIEERSYYYNLILDLNSKTNLTFFIRNLYFRKKYKSKSQLDRASFRDNAIQYVSENYNQIKEYLPEYYRSQKEYKKYKDKVDFYLNQTFDYKQVKKNYFLFFGIEDFKSLEREMINKIIKKNRNNLSLLVHGDYVSPKGQNHWERDQYFDTESLEKILDIVDNKKEYMKTTKYQRSLMSDSLRYDILKRDNFKCQICGASAEEDGVKLEVDHIKPVSKGGLTEPDNLRTLCQRCNQGKKAKY